jgi:hypothetical protein
MSYLNKLRDKAQQARGRSTAGSQPKGRTGPAGGKQVGEQAKDAVKKVRKAFGR